MGSPDYRGWEKNRPLGEGGQGEVFLVRCPVRAKARIEARTTIAHCLGRPSVAPGASLKSAEDLAQALVEFNRQENSEELGALKQFKIPDEAEKKARVLDRFQNELHALDLVVGEPAALRVLDSGPSENWMITEYHPAGSLAHRKP